MPSMSSTEHSPIDKFEICSNGLAFGIVHVFGDEVLADFGEGFRVIGEQL